MLWIVVIGAGVVLMLTGSLVSGGKLLHLDPLFARIAGALLIGGYALAKILGSGTVLIVSLVLAVASLLIALIRGVTR